MMVLKKKVLFLCFILTVLVLPLRMHAQANEGILNDTTYIYRSVTEALKNPDQVFRLYLVKQKLDSVPKEIFGFQNLRELNMSKNNLEEIPAEIGTLTNMEILTLSNNKIVHLPWEIGQLTNLKKLSLNRNQLEDLPPTIGNLQSLEVLELWDNELRDVPDEIEELKNLQLVELRGILFTEEQQKRIDSLIVKSAKLYMSPSCNCKY